MLLGLLRLSLLLCWQAVSGVRLPLLVFQDSPFGSLEEVEGLESLQQQIQEILSLGKSRGSSSLSPYGTGSDYKEEHYVKPLLSKHNVRTLYQVGDSEKELPECEPWAVCSKVDLYDKPWLERQCRCPGQRKCPGLITPNDGHTIVDKTRQFKLCEPVKKLPKCRYFRDMTWTLTVTSENVTSQVVHCHCPKGSVAYLIRRQPFTSRRGSVLGYHYSFACSPQSRLRCERKEPCRLFTVRKRLELLDEVNTSTLCQCPHGHHCPKHHTHPGVLQGKSYVEENIRTYSGYCVDPV